MYTFLAMMALLATSTEGCEAEDDCDAGHAYYESQKAAQEVNDMLEEQFKHYSRGKEERR